MVIDVRPEPQARVDRRVAILDVPDEAPDEWPGPDPEDEPEPIAPVAIPIVPQAQEDEVGLWFG